MATSGSTDFTLTTNELISESYELAGVIPVGDAPDPAQINSAKRSLNLLVKALQADKVYLYSTDSQTLNTVASTATATLASGTTRVIGTPFTRVDGQDTPLNFIDRTSYDDKVSKAGEGKPLDIFVDNAVQPPVAYFYPTPDAIYAVHYRREALIEDFDSAADNPDFPVKAFRMLCYGLAHELAVKFGLDITDRQYLKAEYERNKNEYKAGDTYRNGKEIVAPPHVV